MNIIFTYYFPQAHRNEIARRSQATAADATKKLRKAEKHIVEQQLDHKDVSADLTRQYKTMQTEMGIKVHQLEAEVKEVTLSICFFSEDCSVFYLLG